MTPNNQYTVLPFYYDRLVRADYRRIAAFLDDHIRGSVPDASLVLDLACGTGNITRRLCARGYDMIGADSSRDMLSQAIAKPRPKGKPILWLCQDMTSFELYGTVDAAVCCLDSFNYLTGEGGLSKCFALVRNYLNSGGAFIFDLNTRHKFEQVLRGRVECYRFDDLTCIWQSDYSSRSGLCVHDLTFFIPDTGGLYRRTEERQVQRYYSVNTVRGLLAGHGFALEGLYADYTDRTPTSIDERICFVARKI